MRELAGIVFILEDKMLLVLSEKYEDDDRDKWSIPKGKIDKNETPFEAAKRELKEECKIDLDDLGLGKDECDYVDVLLYRRKNGERACLYYFVFNLDKVVIDSLYVGAEKMAGIGFFNKAIAEDLITSKQIELTKYIKYKRLCLNKVRITPANSNGKIQASSVKTGRACRDEATQTIDNRGTQEVLGFWEKFCSRFFGFTK